MEDFFSPVLNYTLPNGEEYSDELYPLTLGYTLPNGEEYSVFITDEYQAEEEYSKMFELCGPDVQFSVD